MFLKQYGERRTGTNALRALIGANYDDVVVLMHILGDKHSPPVDLDALWLALRDATDRAWQFAVRATEEARAQTTRLTDPRQAQELRRRADALARAFDAGAFGYVISIKDPYAWAVSVQRFLQWPRKVVTERLRAACARYNECYRAWLPLLESARRPALLVRHEDLVRDARGVLDAVDRTFGLSRAAEIRTIDGIARPAHWDDGATPISRMQFDAARYLRDDCLDALEPEYREVVTETMDWELLARFGYAPL